MTKQDLFQEMQIGLTGKDYINILIKLTILIDG